MTKLSVNVNKIAWLRNARGGDYPSIKEFSKICIDSGCQGITVHPRDDMRHINPEDVKILKELTKESEVEFNIEGNPFSEQKGKYPGFLQLIKSYQPDQCTLVPDASSQLTSDHGWDLLGDNSRLASLIKTIKTYGSRVSLFMDPSEEGISKAKEVGADRIELYTGPYAEAVKHQKGIKDLIKQYSKADEHAHNLGLGVNAGHDLNLSNLSIFLSECNIDEVSIGHALVTDSLRFGMEDTVKKYLHLCN